MVMTIKDKLRQNLTGHLSNDKTEVDINIAAKIADDYAIEFAEWLRENYYDNGESWTEWNSNDNTHSSKELLEIFKKEKGL
jgi:hypothetical protein